MAEPLLATTVRQSHAVGCIIVWSAQTLDRLGGLWGATPSTPRPDGTWAALHSDGRVEEVAIVLSA